MTYITDIRMYELNSCGSEGGSIWTAMHLPVVRGQGIPDQFSHYKRFKIQDLYLLQYKRRPVP
jgi:hypothetical protein